MRRRNVGLDRRTDFGTQPRLFEWYGVSHTPSGRQNVKVQYTIRANAVSGEYFLGFRDGRYGHLGRGKFDGTLSSEGVLNLEVGPSQRCIWKFTGVISGERLQGRGIPTFCPGGGDFEWSLELG